MAIAYQAVNTLVLVDQASKAEQIASHLRSTGMAIQQSWVDSASEFSAALQRDAFDLGIIYRESDNTDLPAAILRYPDLPFLVVLSQYRNRLAENFIESGAADVVGFSHPIRLKKVLARTIIEAKLRKNNNALQEQYISQRAMLQSLLQSAQQAIAFIHHGVHSYGNPAYRELTGLQDEEHVLSTPLLDLIDPRDHATINQALRALNTGDCERQSLYCHFIRQDGSRMPVALELTQSWFDEESVVQLSVRPCQFEYSNDEKNNPFSDTIAEQAATAECGQLKSARLRFTTEPINSLRADNYERYCVNIWHEDGAADDLLQDDQSGMTLIDLDRCVILEAINQLAKRLQRNPNTQFLIPLQAEAAQHIGLTQWLQQHIHARSIPARAVTLVMTLTEGSNTFAEHFELTRQMQLAGVGVCIRGITGSTEEQLYLSTNDIDYALLTHPQLFTNKVKDEIGILPEHPLDTTLFDNIRKQVNICRRANVKTMMEAHHPDDIAALWKLGVDCLIGDLESQLECTEV